MFIKMLSVPYLTASILAKLEDIELEKKAVLSPYRVTLPLSSYGKYFIPLDGFLLHSVSKWVSIFVKENYGFSRCMS